jgi:hypothetical protein
MARRRYGTGSLRRIEGQTSQWLLRASLGKNPESGKYEQRSWRFFAPSRDAAEQHSAELIASIRPKRHRKSEATVATLLEKYWEFFQDAWDHSGNATN